MAIHSYFFDAQLVDGNYDREYYASDMARYLDGLVGNGVFPIPSNSLQVRAGSGMQVIVAAGMGWIDGYKLINDADMTLNIDNADANLNRIDRVVFRVNMTTRLMEIVVRKGNAASSPTAPPVTRSQDMIEYSLATITVNRQTQSISNSMIRDTRLDSDVCGIVQGLIQQVDTSTLFDQWTTAYDEQYETFSQQFDTWFTNLKNQVAGAKMMDEYRQRIVTTDANTKSVAISIPEYVHGVDVFAVYVNGMRMSHAYYTNDGTTITFTNTLDVVGTEIEFVVYKAIGEGISGGEEGPSIPGKDGREIEIQNNGTAIQWRYVGEDAWTDVVQLSDLKGDNGQIGATPNIQIGTVQTLEPEQQATASITGTPENPLLNLGIPKGENGSDGETGATRITTLVNDAGREKMQSMVSFVDDDCRSDVYTVLFPLIKTLHIPYTLACPTGNIGDPLYVTEAQLKEMYNYGLSIACHTVNQTNMDTIDRDQLRAILEQSLEDLARWGIDDVRTYAYCQGKYTVDNIQVVKEFFDAGFLTDKGINQIPYESYYLRRVGLFPSTGSFTLAQAKEYVDELAGSGGWLIFMTHCYTDTFSSSELTELVNYVKGKSIEIVDVNEALDHTGNVIEIGHYKKNDLESGHYFVVDSLGRMHTDSVTESSGGSGGTSGLVNESVTLTLNEGHIIGKETSTSNKGKDIAMTSSNTTHVVSRPVDVTDCDTVIVTGWAYSGYGIYSFLDTDGECVSALWSTHSLAEGADLIEKEQIAVPENASTIIIAGHKDYIMPALKKVKNSGQQIVLPLSGMKWTCVGDSLTEENSRTTKHYSDYVSERTGIEVVNMGESGTGYKKGEDSSIAFYQRVLDIPTDSDVVTVFGSGNDLTLTLGEITDTGTNTICGCVNTTIDNIYDVVPTARLIIVSPTPWQSYNPASEGNAMDLYSEALGDICRRRGIPFLDLYHCSGLRPWDAEFRTLAYSKDDGNGVHPDETGHEIISWAFQSAIEGSCQIYSNNVETSTGGGTASPEEVAEIVMENYLEIIDDINGEAVYTTDDLEIDLDTVNGEVI